ncbi:hypothetical protein ACFL02_02725 [Planctomycetota bacterium]
MNPGIQETNDVFHGAGLAWKDVTTIHPVGLSAVIILGIMMLLLPRRWTVLPMIIIACFISSAQKIVIFSLDFNFLRIMVLFGVTRLLMRREYRNFNWKNIDKVLILYTVCAMLILTIQTGSFNYFINRLGFSFDALGMYFLFRCLIRNWQDIDRLINGCIIVGIPVMVAFAVEKATQRNMFAVFGGVPEFTMIRDGKLRCQGAFSHPILAGCFWAVLMPLFAAQWWKKSGGKIWAVIGVAVSTFIIFTCHSSTPFFAFICVFIGGIVFPFRHRMREILLGLVGLLIALEIIMKAHVWALVARASVVVGGTGYHRYALIDAFIRRFGEWWLWGTRSTAKWSWGGEDITVQYILEGVRGGIWTLALFIIIIVLAFRGVGRLWRISTGNSYRLALSWALGVSLFIHCINFIGVSYFGQIYIVWYLTLGMIGSMSPKKARLRYKTPEVIQNQHRQRNAASLKYPS